MQSIESIETYPHGMSKDLIRKKKKKIKRMFNFDYITKKT